MTLMPRDYITPEQDPEAVVGFDIHHLHEAVTAIYGRATNEVTADIARRELDKIAESYRLLGNVVHLLAAMEARRAA